jgi:hypothetical protein
MIEPSNNIGIACSTTESGSINHLRVMFRSKGSALFSAYPTLDSGNHTSRLPHLKATGADDLLAAASPANSDRPLSSAADIAWAKDPWKSA